MVNQNAELKKLREEEAELRNITEALLDVVFVVSKRGKLLYVSPSTKRVLGYSPKETVGTNFLKYIPLREVPRYLKMLKVVLSSKEYVIFQSYIKHRDGRNVPVEVQGSIVRRGNKSVILGTVRDITERKQAQEAMKESEEKFRAITESSPESIIILDQKGNIIDCNSRTLKMHGYSSKSDLIGKSILELTTRRDWDKVKRSIPLLLKGKVTRDSEFLLRKRNGHEFPGEISVSMVKDSEGKPRFLIALGKDITKRKETENAIRNRKEELEKINKITIGREVKMMEMKKRIAELESKLKEAAS
jgi:PAS domain S-box-containing protein